MPRPLPGRGWDAPLLPSFPGGSGCQEPPARLPPDIAAEAMPLCPGRPGRWGAVPPPPPLPGAGPLQPAQTPGGPQPPSRSMWMERGCSTRARRDPAGSSVPVLGTGTPPTPRPPPPALPGQKPPRPRSPLPSRGRAARGTAMLPTSRLGFAAPGKAQRREGRRGTHGTTGINRLPRGRGSGTPGLSRRQPPRLPRPGTRLLPSAPCVSVPVCTV